MRAEFVASEVGTSATTDIGPGGSVGGQRRTAHRQGGKAEDGQLIH